MFNWIGLYLVNELIYQNGTGPMYDVRNTRTLNLSKNADFAQSLIPDFGLNKLVRDQQHHHCHLPGGSGGCADLGGAEQDYFRLRAQGRWSEQERCPLRRYQREEEHHPLHGHCRCAGGLWRRPVLSVQRVPVEPAELHQPAGHGLQRYLGGTAGKLEPHRYRVLCAVHLPHLGRRLLPVHQILPH